MSRISAVFQQLADSRRRAVIPYITAGDPQPAVTVPVLHALAAAGADLIELGVPFSEPMADGPVIQKACERALTHGVDLRQVLSMVAQFRVDNRTTPIVLMGYMNPIERYGVQRFVQDAHAAGVDGVLVVDLPPEEAGELRQALLDSAMDEIFLVAPTTTAARCASIAAQASGFIYYVALKGVTGAGHLDNASLRAPLAELRRHTDLPVAVGFGIKDATGAAAVAAEADAVVIGSALVETLQYAGDAAQAAQRASEFLTPLRHAVDVATAAAEAAGGAEAC